MRSPAAISINYNFSAGKSAVAMRSANFKSSGWINIVLNFIIKKFFGNNLFYYIFNYVFFNCFLLSIGVMLSRNNNSINTFRFISAIILNSNLRFGIRSKIRHQAIVSFSDVSQFFYQLMSIHNRHWH